MKVIVTDLDNTLLHTDKTLSAHTVAVLTQCRSQGIKIVFATARSRKSAARVIDLFCPDIFIGFGGALVTTATGEIIRREEIPQEIAQSLIAECLKTPEITGIYATTEFVALSNNQAFVNEKNGDFAHYQFCDFSGKIEQGFLKISTDSEAKNVVEKIGAHYPQCDLLHYSGEPMSRFASRKAVKWEAVQGVAAYLGIPTADFIAFGDDSNDVEMLEKCGTGVAVANAIPQAKAVADQICLCNDEDGVAKYLMHHLALL